MRFAHGVGYPAPPALFFLTALEQAEDEAEEEEFGEGSMGAESQDMHVDEILSGIATDVASRGPPTPRKVQNETFSSCVKILSS